MSWLSDVLGGSTFDSWLGDQLFSETLSLLVNARLVPLTRPLQFSKSVEDTVMQRINFTILL